MAAVAGIGVHRIRADSVAPIPPLKETKMSERLETLKKARERMTEDRDAHAKVLAAPFDRDKAERARNNFIEIQMLIDALDRAISGRDFNDPPLGPATRCWRQPDGSGSRSSMARCQAFLFLRGGYGHAVKEAPA